MELLLRPWKMYTDATGRARRSEFWLFYVVKYAVLVFLLAPIFLFDARTGQGAPGGAANIVVIVPLLVWVLATFVPSVTLMARRLHDFDVSGKWCATTFIPYVGFLAVIVIGLIPGTKGENERGYDPRISNIDEVSAVFE